MVIKCKSTDNSWTAAVSNCWHIVLPPSWRAVHVQGVWTPGDAVFRVLATAGVNVWDGGYITPSCSLCRINHPLQCLFLCYCAVSIAHSNAGSQHTLPYSLVYEWVEYFGNLFGPFRVKQFSWKQSLMENSLIMCLISHLSKLKALLPFGSTEAQMTIF